MARSPRPGLARLFLLATAGLVGSFGACASFSGGDTGSSAAEGGPDALVDPADVLADRGAPSAYRDAILAAGPLAYWRMGVTEGVSIPDESGNNNPLILEGATVLGEPGAIDGDSDKALRFDGKTGRARAMFPRKFDFAMKAPFTIELWAKRDPIDGGSYFQHIVSHTQGINGNRTGFLLYVKPKTTAPDMAEPFMAFEVNAIAKEAAAVVRPPVALSRWAHYTAVFEDTTATLALYVDAKTSGSALLGGPMTVDTARLYVGGSENGDAFPGTIDEVAIYARALSVTEIEAHKKLGQP